MEDNETNADAAAMQAAEAGYASRKATMEGNPKAAPVASAQPPADTTASPAPTAQPLAAEGDDEPSPQAEPEKKPPAPEEAISAQLEDLKAQVRELKASGVDRSTVDRLNGQIGGMTRVIKQLQKNIAPADSEVKGAIEAAEKVAQDYPDLGVPMLNALKALAARIPEKEAVVEEEPPQAAAPAQAAADPYTAEQKAAIKALDDAHPDRFDLNKSAEFTAWLKSKGPDYERTFTTSWNPATLSAGYTEFKLDKAAKEAARKRKQDRLVAAETPTGVVQTGPTVLPDEAGFQIGYDRIKKQRAF